jgi:transposase
MLEYKCKLFGIRFQTINESYTSKCSFIDREFPKKYESYLGRRINRGMFKTAEAVLINADMNAALNIFIKATDGMNFVERPNPLVSRGNVIWPLKACFQ